MIHPCRDDQGWWGFAYSVPREGFTAKVTNPKKAMLLSCLQSALSIRKNTRMLREEGLDYGDIGRLLINSVARTSMVSYDPAQHELVDD